MIKVSAVRLPIDYNNDDIKHALQKRLNVKERDIVSFELLKLSIDARKKDDIFYTASLAVSLKNEDNVSYDKYIRAPRSLDELGLDMVKKDARVTIVGSGPAGLFSALLLSKVGVKVTVIERGSDVDTRTKAVERMKLSGVLDVETNIQFGEGGAGTFSDGKLYSGINDKFFGVIFGEFVAHGAPEDILYSAHPHIGTDYLKEVVKNMRKDIESLGGKVLFNTKLVDLIIENDKLKEIEISSQGKVERMACDRLILAIGHSARDTFEWLYGKGINMLAKPFSMGVRVEHKQEMISKSQYGKFYDKLPPAIYKLSTRLSNGRSAYTFCMCPGGEVVCASSEESAVVTNGMSEYARDKENANSAVLVSVTPEDYGGNPLDGIAFQRKYERLAYSISNSYKAPCQLYGDMEKNRASTALLSVKNSYKPGVIPTDLRECLPDFVYDGIKDGIKDFDRKLHGFAHNDTLLTGVETRSSSPVRILRDEQYESNVKGVYPCGEGAGYAGGITSSATDGIKVALSIYKEIMSK